MASSWASSARRPLSLWHRVPADAASRRTWPAHSGIICLKRSGSMWTMDRNGKMSSVDIQFMTQPLPAPIAPHVKSDCCDDARRVVLVLDADDEAVFGKPDVFKARD